MTIPIANVTLDIYREGNSPPAAPDVAAVPGHLSPTFRLGLHRGRLLDPAQRFSHVLLVAADVDVRDIYDAGTLVAGHEPDTAYIAGDPYRVVFVERRQRGTAADHLRVYLARGTPGT